MRSLGLAIGAIGLALLSCAQTARLLPAVALDFFVEAPRDNPWNQKIRNWQSRHQLDQMTAPEHRRGESDLLDEWERFALEQRRRLVADAVIWVQDESRRHYISDGETDHWATLSDVVAADGDDCDGLDLLTFLLLRRFGFSKDEIFRAIVVDRGSGQHHMVTLWFESGSRADPWVLDPTGVVTAQLVRLSEVPKWSPIEMFDEVRHFRVEESTRSHAVAENVIRAGISPTH